MSSQSSPVKIYNLVLRVADALPATADKDSPGFIHGEIEKGKLIRLQVVMTANARYDRDGITYDTERTLFEHDDKFGLTHCTCEERSWNTERFQTILDSCEPAGGLAQALVDACASPEDLLKGLWDAGHIDADAVRSVGSMLAARSINYADAMAKAVAKGGDK
jgi:hypothetical protein